MENALVESSRAIDELQKKLESTEHGRNNFRAKYLELREVNKDLET